MLSTASESSWSNGKCERMVGLLKEGMSKLKDDRVNNKKMCLAWTISTHNGMIMNHGFSLNQRYLGEM